MSVRKSTKVSIALTICLAAAAIAAAAGVVLPAVRDAQLSASVSEFRNPAASADPAPSEAGGAASPGGVDWEGLISTNAATRGWIEVPGTNIDYPLVQESPAAVGHWLYYAFEGNAAYYGCPYIDAACESTGGLDSPLVTLYGHSLLNGTMFSSLMSYSDPAFARDHLTIKVFTPEEERTLEVFAADVVNADRETILASAETTEEALAYAKEKASTSDVFLAEPSGSGRIYQLVTCSYQTGNSRTVVYAQEMPRVGGAAEAGEAEGSDGSEAHEA